MTPVALPCASLSDTGVRTFGLRERKEDPKEGHNDVS